MEQISSKVFEYKVYCIHMTLLLSEVGSIADNLYQVILTFW